MIWEAEILYFSSKAGVLNIPEYSSQTGLGVTSTGCQGMAAALIWLQLSLRVRLPRPCSTSLFLQAAENFLHLQVSPWSCNSPWQHIPGTSPRVQGLVQCCIQSRSWQLFWLRRGPGAALDTESQDLLNHSPPTCSAFQHQHSKSCSGLKNLLLSSSIIKEQAAPLAQEAGQNALNLGIFNAFVLIFIALQNTNFHRGMLFLICAVCC